jgi:LPXTG-site transpeptidase (sortase) family protein
MRRRTLLGAAVVGAVPASACSWPWPAGRAAPREVSPPSGGDGPPRVVTYVASGAPVRQPDHLELPLRLVIPRIGVDAPVIAVGLTADGAMDVPERAEEVGWYQYSPRPGLKGNAVLAGHLNWRGVDGVFRHLASLAAGDTVIVRAANGQERPYTVSWRREWPVATAPIGTVFELLERPALTLITCGGSWNPVTQRYDTRVVVRAQR